MFRRVGTFRRVQEHHPLPMYRHIDRATTSNVQAHRPSYFRCTGIRATFRRCTGSYFDVALGTDSRRSHRGIGGPLTSGTFGVRATWNFHVRPGISMQDLEFLCRTWNFVKVHVRTWNFMEFHSAFEDVEFVTFPGITRRTPGITRTELLHHHPANSDMCPLQRAARRCLPPRE